MRDVVAIDSRRSASAAATAAADRRLASEAEAKVASGWSGLTGVLPGVCRCHCRRRTKSAESREDWVGFDARAAGHTKMQQPHRQTLCTVQTVTGKCRCGQVDFNSVPFQHSEWALGCRGPFYHTSHPFLGIRKTESVRKHTRPPAARAATLAGVVQVGEL